MGATAVDGSGTEDMLVHSCGVPRCDGRGSISASRCRCGGCAYCATGVGWCKYGCRCIAGASYS
ncbi:hypothetical protein HYPSUDRAFT_69500 [Hypholoma sublateritium FD-334 SS-4]|uniref:Uncharacterized protein n=1 Tax=Hypholoma sublateritium (strain FD-334 SS-4) TaxID=945553 RepID=A0A0D2NJ82_HYPSF|nr:hypothetical protein HYPSUDRAFT_69500 [Hypholoma sublateritium FD-334 SS-4]